MRFYSDKVPGPAIQFNCPNCKKNQVTSEAYEQLEGLYVLGLFPLQLFRNTFVVCGECKKKSLVKLKLENLTKYDADSLERYTSSKKSGSVVSAVITVAAIFLFWIPFVGIILAVTAIFLAKRGGGRLDKVLAFSALALSIFVTCAIVFFSGDSSCSSIKAGIYKKVKEGRKCTSDKQCTDPKLTCPFDCVVVNRVAAVSIQTSASRYFANCAENEKCQPKCADKSKEVYCKNGSCTFR